MIRQLAKEELMIRFIVCGSSFDGFMFGYNDTK